MGEGLPSEWPVTREDGREGGAAIGGRVRSRPDSPSPFKSLPRLVESMVDPYGAQAPL